jgi:hypothetical protein
MDNLIRFLAGGMIVSAFAVLADVLRPKSFAGLFGAAPSVALATLGLALWNQGADYVAVEGRSMVLGALALALYSCATCHLMMRARWPALAATSAPLALWLAAALCARYALIG